MEKEIPNSHENTTKGGRLRDAARQLRTLPVDQMPPNDQWDEITGELTKDELVRLETMAQGHLDRALDAEKADEALDEATSAILLRPLDAGWAQSVASALRTRNFSGAEVHAFFAAVDRRTGTKGRRKTSVPPWAIVVALVVLLAPPTAWALFTFWPGVVQAASLKTGTGPRTLESAVDTQGVKANTTIVGSKLVVFPESTVAEFSAWVTFPDHRVDVWEGSVSVLDSSGTVLASRDVNFRTSSQGPLDPGQGVEIFQQFDAWPWYDKAASFLVGTKRILAKEDKPRQRQELPLAGVNGLTSGYNLKVWLLGSRWTERFASYVQNLDLELENTGLKPFAELQLALRWVDPSGRVLKTQTFRPVSAFRTALPSGASLGWSQETVFDTEVFGWAAGQEPHPVLELVHWQ